MQSSTKTNKTNPSTTKFLFCFKPVVMEDAILRPYAPRKTRSLGRNMADRVDPMFKYVHHKDDDGVTFSKLFQPYPSNYNNYKESIDSKKKIHKKFARLLKAVWFETSLAKKIKNRKSTNEEPQEPNGSVIVEEEVEKESNTTPKKSSDNLPPKGSFPPTSAVKLAKNTNFTLRHSHSSPSVNSMEAMGNLPPIQPNPLVVKHQQQKQPQQQKQKEEINLQEEYGKGCHSTNYGLCLILISLLVLVLWGKACAIICTSTWLFLVPLFLQTDHKRSSNYRNGIHGQEIDTLEYKKKIIMEGLLERTNHINPSLSKE